MVLDLDKAHTMLWHATKFLGIRWRKPSSNTPDRYEDRERIPPKLDRSAGHDGT